MLARILLALGLLAAALTPAHAAGPYPCDILPKPVACYGMAKLVAGYSGNALAVAKQNAATNTTVGFTAAGALDTTALDAFTASDDYARVTKWNDQSGGAYDAQASLETPPCSPSDDCAPRIATQNVGNARGLIVQGGSLDGSIFSMTLPTAISAWALGSTNYTVIAVIQPSVALARNNGTGGALSPTTGTILSLETSGGTILSRLYGNGSAPGGWATIDSGAFSYTCDALPIMNSPHVLALTSDTTGVKIWQDESACSTTSKSAVAGTAGIGYIGKTGASTPGASSLAGDFKIVALLIYNRALTQAQRATVSNALYKRFGIDSYRSRFYSYGLTGVGDSIEASFDALGQYGMLEQIQNSLPSNVRVVNFGIPGSTCTPQSGGAAQYAYTQGLMPLAVSRTGGLTKRGSILFILCGGNDLLIQTSATVTTPVASPGKVHWTSHGLSAGARFVLSCSGCTLPSPLIAGTIYYVKTVYGADDFSLATTSGGTELNFTGSSSGTQTGTAYNITAATIYDGIKDIAAQGTAAGFTKVYVGTILPRANADAIYYPFITDINALITAGSGVDGFTACDTASAVTAYPNADFGDSVHPSTSGHAKVAAKIYSCMSSEFNFLLQRDLDPANDNQPMWLRKAA